ncbi:Nif11-like leader peptide family natural product precursor [Leptothermofonsia sp. ETS-13]|uniref:Nif11-like leader peptide family natural product precursor n=1 Tax=Leptothermofonsia sp. ETS-13 TaxID=3035696 RepID=UPI003BA2DE5D
MATATVLQFMQKTAEDEALRQQLESLLGVGDGNISSEAELDTEETEALKGERAPVVAEFAAKNGYDFSVDELITVVDAFQKHQAGQLSDKEFATLLGLSMAIESSEIASPLKRLANYMSKTYLGIDLTGKK